MQISNDDTLFIKDCYIVAFIHLHILLQKILKAWQSHFCVWKLVWLYLRVLQITETNTSANTSYHKPVECIKIIKKLTLLF